MGWNYPDVSLEDLMRLIKGFMDILILTSGYQSSGRIAYWDVQNIKRAFQWGFFFEKVFRYLGSSDVYEDSIRELDTALSEMKSNASFPQGLAHISSVTLANAQDFVSEHLINTLPLKVEHLRAFLTTVVEMDLDELSQAEDDCLTAYLNKLGLQDASHPLVPKKMGSSKDLDMLCPDIALNKVVKKSTGDYFTKYTVKTLLKRWSAMSCLSTVETGLHILFNCVKCMNWSESDITSLEGLQENDKAQRSAEQLVDFITWNQWKSNHLLYFLDRRTVRLVSGASMIFSAPKIQWVNVIEGLNVREESSDADISETIELLLLGSVAHRWNRLLEHLMSVSYYSLPISEQYHQVLNVLSGSCQSFHSKTEVMSSEIYIDVLLLMSTLQITTEGKRGATMKFSRFSSFGKFQFLKFWKRFGRAGSSVTLGNVQRRPSIFVSFDCCHGSFSLRKLVVKFKTQWKQSLGWQRSSPQYSYDLRSYSLNFDDGLHNENRPPHGC
ncbi:Fanconi anemia group F protein (FANCF) [Quillaja saponaria]|uniref:Fanconi anemia group F protein (FANCF) n=1 Tax=Quillaja saponaria TaxID=32244 RepID=A0AAD7VIV6_QUISA|nr:Fanconi anemia group F protein (FANCF) [Quillaja saponaria]